MPPKTHTSAVVIIPPRELWGPIQAIRRRYDNRVRRWMPHITLLYPFRPWDMFDLLERPLASACRSVEPFEVILGRFRWFEHTPGNFTVWLTAEPAELLRRLHEALWRVVPDCGDVRQFPGGFTPHLSVGQVRGRAAMEELIESLQSVWRPLSFTVREVALIYRNEPPDDVFRVDRTLSLGSGRATRL